MNESSCAFKNNWGRKRKFNAFEVFQNADMLTVTDVRVLGVARLMELTNFQCKVRSTFFAKEITAQ